MADAPKAIASEEEGELFPVRTGFIYHIKPHRKDIKLDDLATMHRPDHAPRLKELNRFKATVFHLHECSFILIGYQGLRAVAMA